MQKFFTFSYFGISKKNSCDIMTDLVRFIELEHVKMENKPLVSFKEIRELTNDYLHPTNSLYDYIDKIVDNMNFLQFPNIPVAENLKNIFNDLTFKKEVKYWLHLILLYKKHSLKPLSEKKAIDKINSSTQSQNKLRNIIKSFRHSYFRENNSYNDRAEIAKKLSSPSYINSLINDEKTTFKLILERGLIANNPYNNPYINLIDEESNMYSDIKNLNRDTFLNKLKSFINAFSLHSCSISNQGEEWELIANYIIERITNINFMNNAYNLFINSDKQRTFFWLKTLSIYPLLNFRIKLANLIYKKDIPIDMLKSIYETIMYQTFCYFPLLYSLLQTYLSKNESIVSTKFIKAISDQIKEFVLIDNHLYSNYNFFIEENKKTDLLIINPIYTFPSINDDHSAINVYLKRYNEIMKFYLDTLTFKMKHNIFDYLCKARNLSFITNVKNLSILSNEQHLLDTQTQYFYEFMDNYFTKNKNIKSIYSDSYYVLSKSKLK